MLHLYLPASTPRVTYELEFVAPSDTIAGCVQDGAVEQCRAALGEAVSICMDFDAHGVPVDSDDRLPAFIVRMYRGTGR